MRAKTERELLQYLRQFDRALSGRSVRTHGVIGIARKSQAALSDNMDWMHRWV